MLNFKMHVFYIKIQRIYMAQFQEMSSEERKCLKHITMNVSTFKLSRKLFQLFKHNTLA